MIRQSSFCCTKQEAERENCCSGGPAAITYAEDNKQQQQPSLAPATTSPHHHDIQQHSIAAATSHDIQQQVIAAATPQRKNFRQQQQHDDNDNDEEKQQIQPSTSSSLLCERTYQVKIDENTIWQVPTRLKFVKKIGSGAYGCVASFEETTSRERFLDEDVGCVADKDSSSRGGEEFSREERMCDSVCSGRTRETTHSSRGGKEERAREIEKGRGESSSIHRGTGERRRGKDEEEEEEGGGRIRRKDVAIPLQKKCLAVKKIGDLFRDLIDAKRIYREIKILKELQHENIISLVEILDPLSPDFDDIYLVSDLMDTDLHRVIYSRQTLTTEHHQYFLYQILLGLSFLHQAEIIHRDLKPSNILVNLNCDIKICDFGLARGLYIHPPSHIQQQQQTGEITCRCCCSRNGNNSTINSSSNNSSNVADSSNVNCNNLGIYSSNVPSNSLHSSHMNGGNNIDDISSGNRCGREILFNSSSTVFPSSSSSLTSQPHTNMHTKMSLRMQHHHPSAMTATAGKTGSTVMTYQNSSAYMCSTSTAGPKNGPIVTGQSSGGSWGICSSCGCNIAATDPTAFACEEEARNLELTDYVVTRWYRPPEILISPFCYSKPVDLWSVGCIFAELLGRRAIFAGKDHFDQLRKIIKIMGRPSSAELNKVVNEGRNYPIYTNNLTRSSKYGCPIATAGGRGGGGKDCKAGCRNCKKSGESRHYTSKHKRSDAAKKFIESLPHNEPYNLADLFPDASPAAIDLLSGLLAFDPENRYTVQEALRHEYFEGLHSPEDEPRVASPVDWSFDNFIPTKRLLQNKVYEEILSFHPEIVLRDFPALPSRGILISPSTLPSHIRSSLASLQQRAAASAATRSTSSSRSNSFSCGVLPSTPHILQQQQQQTLHEVQQQRLEQERRKQRKHQSHRQPQQVPEHQQAAPRQQQTAQQQQQHQQLVSQQQYHQQIAEQQQQQHQIAEQQQQHHIAQQQQQMAQQHRQNFQQHSHWHQQQDIQEQVCMQGGQQQQQGQEQQHLLPQCVEHQGKLPSFSVSSVRNNSGSQRRQQEALRTVNEQLSPTPAAATGTAADRSSVTTSASSMPCCSSPDASAFAEVSTQQQQQASMLRLLPASGAGEGRAAVPSSAGFSGPGSRSTTREEAATTAEDPERNKGIYTKTVECFSVVHRSSRQPADSQYSRSSSFPFTAPMYDYNVVEKVQQQTQQQEHILPVQQQQHRLLRQPQQLPHRHQAQQQQRQQHVQQHQQVHQQQQQQQHQAQQQHQEQYENGGSLIFEKSTGEECFSVELSGQLQTAVTIEAAGAANAAATEDCIIVCDGAEHLSPSPQPAATATVALAPDHTSEQRRSWRSKSSRRNCESSTDSVEIDKEVVAVSSVSERPGEDVRLLTVLHTLQGCCDQNSSSNKMNTGENVVAGRRTTAGSRPSTNPSASLSSLPRTTTSFSLPSVQSLTPCCPENFSTAEQHRGSVGCSTTSLTSAAPSSSSASVVIPHEEDLFTCPCAVEKKAENAAAAPGSSQQTSFGSLVGILEKRTTDSNRHIPPQQIFYNETAAAPAETGALVLGDDGDGRASPNSTARIGTTAGAETAVEGGGTTAGAVAETTGIGGVSSTCIVTAARAETNREGHVEYAVPGECTGDIAEKHRTMMGSSRSSSKEKNQGDIAVAEGDSTVCVFPHAAGTTMEGRLYCRLDSGITHLVARAGSVPFSASPGTYACCPPSYGLPTYSQLPDGSVVALPPFLVHEQQPQPHSTETESNSHYPSNMSCCSIASNRQQHRQHSDRRESADTTAGATLLMLAATCDSATGAPPALLASVASPLDNNTPQPASMSFFSSARTQHQPRETLQQRETQHQLSRQQQRETQHQHWDMQQQQRETQQHWDMHQQREMRQQQENMQQHLTRENMAVPWTKGHLTGQQSMQHFSIPFANRQQGSCADGGAALASFDSAIVPSSSKAPQQQQHIISLPNPPLITATTTTTTRSSSGFQQRAAAQSISMAAATTSRNTLGPLGRGGLTMSASTSRGMRQTALAPSSVDTLFSPGRVATTINGSALPTRSVSALDTSNLGASRSQSDSSCGGYYCAIPAVAGDDYSCSSRSRHMTQSGCNTGSCTYGMNRSRSKPEPPVAAATASLTVSMGSDLPRRASEDISFLLMELNNGHKNELPIFTCPGGERATGGHPAEGAGHPAIAGTVPIAAGGSVGSEVSCGIQHGDCWGGGLSLCDIATVAGSSARVRPVAACSSTGAERYKEDVGNETCSSNRSGASCSASGIQTDSLLERDTTKDGLRLLEEEKHQEYAADSSNNNIFSLVDRTQQRPARNHASFLQGLYSLQGLQGQDGPRKQQERCRGAAGDDVAIPRGSQQQDVMMSDREESSNNRSCGSSHKHRSSQVRRIEGGTPLFRQAEAAGAGAAAGGRGGEGARGDPSCCMDVDFFLQQEAAEQTLLLSAIREQQQQQGTPARGGGFSDHATQLLHHETYHTSNGLQKQHANPTGHHVKS